MAWCKARDDVCGEINDESFGYVSVSYRKQRVESP